MKFRAYAIVVCTLLFATLACNLNESPTPQPTIGPAAVLQNPVVGLNPVSGPPGTVIRVSAAGFPAGAKVNLYLSPIDAINQNPIAQDLTIAAGGVLSFAMQLPSQVGNTTLNGTVPLNLTLSTTDSTVKANAIFVALSGTTGAGTPTVTAQAGSSGGTTTDGGTSGGTVTQLFITSPAIGSAIAGNSVVVTGSGRAFNSRVGVQVLDANQKVIGSAFAVIQAGANAVGPWETAVGFTQPAAASAGYIVAYTINAQGTVAEQASIPIALVGAGVVAPTATLTGVPPTTAPTVPAVITVAPPASTALPFITATRQP
ncbi:MAG: hypothetical protein IT324_26070 [Anaerolineae bacterium]|nr:hypothetical protein [Anaerolineae bacterium]